MTTPITPAQARELAKSNPIYGFGKPMQKALESLAQQVEALTADLSAEKLFSSQAMESVTEIAAQRDALKPDAKLYRHLRDHFAKTATDAKAEFARLEPLTGAAFDAAVRASMDLMGVAA